MLQDTNRNPDLLTSINRIVEAHLADLHTAMPAVIQKYDPATQLADVQPIFKRVFLNDDDSENIVDYPVITDVPVAFPQGGGAYLTFPLAAGDRVMLVFSQRSIDEWKETDGKAPIDPGDSRRHHLTDAVIWAGISTARNPIANVSGTDVVLGTSGGAKVILGAGSANASGNALVRQSDAASLTTVFNAHVHPHPFGPTGPPTTSQTATGSSVVFAE